MPTTCWPMASLWTPRARCRRSRSIKEVAVIPSVGEESSAVPRAILVARRRSALARSGKRASWVFRAHERQESPPRTSPSSAPPARSEWRSSASSSDGTSRSPPEAARLGPLGRQDARVQGQAVSRSRSRAPTPSRASTSPSSGPVLRAAASSCRPPRRRAAWWSTTPRPSAWTPTRRWWCPR